MFPTLLRGALGAAALLCLSGPLQAHVTLERGEAAAGSAYRGVLKLNHGCDGAATTAITVTVPAGLTGLRPMPKPGWTLTLSPPAADGSRAIAWSGGSVPDAFYDEFVFVGRIAAEPGAALALPVEQACGDRQVVWGDAPGSESKTPAPVIRVVAAEARAPASVKAGALTIEAPWIRATPPGAPVAGGFLRVSNAGPEPDRLLAASIPLARASEVHETTTRDGIARMAPVAGGLAIPPGGSVELRPGGYHIMFTGLTGPAQAGATLAGSLTFEKAGTVPVTFTVRPVGAAGPASGAGGEAHH